jgi:hypothetical protein
VVKDPNHVDFRLQFPHLARKWPWLHAERSPSGRTESQNDPQIIFGLFEGLWITNKLRCFWPNLSHQGFTAPHLAPPNHRRVTEGVPWPWNQEVHHRATDLVRPTEWSRHFAMTWEKLGKLAWGISQNGSLNGETDE